MLPVRYGGVGVGVNSALQWPNVGAVDFGVAMGEHVMHDDVLP